MLVPLALIASACTQTVAPNDAADAQPVDQYVVDGPADMWGSDALATNAYTATDTQFVQFGAYGAAVIALTFIRR